MKILDFILRNGLLILVGILSLYMITPLITEYRTLGLIITFEVLAVILSSLAIYAFTNINWLKDIRKGEDGQESILDLLGNKIVIAFIFSSVHILVGLVVFGVYIAQFTN